MAALIYTMMSLFKNTKVMGGVVVVVALACIAYYYWGNGSGSSAVVTVDTSPASQELLQTLASLHSTKLDASIFSNPLFQSLTDFGVTIPPQPTGRGNPFAPIGSAFAGVSAPTPPTQAPAPSTP